MIDETDGFVFADITQFPLIRLIPVTQEQMRTAYHRHYLPASGSISYKRFYDLFVPDDVVWNNPFASKYPVNRKTIRLAS